MEAEKASCLPESSAVKSYSTMECTEVSDEDKSESFFYDCCYRTKKRLFPQHFKSEVKEQVKLAWGICANSFFGFIIPLTMLFVVGQKGKIPLASAGLGLSICNVTGNAYVVGITSVCETYFSQAYGAKQMRRYGIILQRASIITTIAVLPSCALWINVDKILLHLGQEREVAMLAGQYTLWFIPGIFFFVLFNLLLRYLACQNIVYPSTYSAFAAFIVNGICCYVFVYVCDLGVVGGVLAVDVSYLIYSVVLLIFIFWKKFYKETWYGWSYECFCEWRSFISLSVSSMVLTICVWTCFEIGTIALGIIGSLEQAVQIVLCGVAGIVYFINFGFSITAAVRVGHFIGSGEPERAKLSMRVALKLAVFFSVSIGLLLIALQDYIVYMFTSDRSVVKATSKLVYLISIMGSVDCLEVVTMGAVRGLGFQKYGAIFTFISFICIGISSSLLLIFKAHLGVPGFWIGILIAIAVQLIQLFTLLYKTDWMKVSESVRANVGVVTESTSDLHQSQVSDGGEKANNLNSEHRNSVRYVSNEEYPSNDTQAETVYLITETSLNHEPKIPPSSRNAKNRDGENKESYNAAKNAVDHANQDKVSETFFIHQPPHLSKLDIFLKVALVTFLLCGVATSAVVRIYL